MEENQLIWVTKRNKICGYGEKIKTHQLEKLHRAFSLFIVDERGNMLVQLRAKSKYHSGGLLSNACCSHPYKGESWNHALERCIENELGVKLELPKFRIKKGYIDKQLFFCGSFIYYSKYEDLSEHEYDHVFVYQCDRDFKNKIQLNPNEITEIYWLNDSEMNELIQHEDKITTWFPLVYDMVKKEYMKG